MCLLLKYRTWQAKIQPEMFDKDCKVLSNKSDFVSNKFVIRQPKCYELMVINWASMRDLVYLRVNKLKDT